MKRKLQIFLILVAVLLFLGTIWSTRRQHKLATAFEKIQIGTMEADVKIQLGNPWRTGACGQFFGGSAPQGCKEECIYASPFPRIAPRYWAFRFDDRGRLIDKYEYQSP